MSSKTLGFTHVSTGAGSEHIFFFHFLDFLHTRKESMKRRRGEETTLEEGRELNGENKNVKNE